MDSKEAQQQLAAYDNLYQFFVGRIYPRFGGSPEEIAAFIGAIKNDYPEDLIREGKILLQNSPFPWKAVQQAANVSAIASEETGKEWLKNIIEIMEKNRPSTQE